MPMRHGLTMGEMGPLVRPPFDLDVDYRVIEMHDWLPEAGPGFGWPESRIWINPSPNAASLNMARAYAGTVMIEGATLSEGRGTTRPLEVLFGAPDVDCERGAGPRCAVSLPTGSRLRDPRMLVHADLPQARGNVVQRPDDPRLKGRSMATRHSAPGGSRRWPSRRSGGSIPIIRSGAIFPTSTSSNASRST
jgi:hypothetical protein